ncbi:MAG: trehalose-6-phosphate synthase [Dehalococcoidia bacterium]
MKLIWSKESLCNLIKEKFSDYHLIVVSNREPYIHNYVGGKIKCEVAVGGVTTALDSVMCATGGLWIACGSSTADRKTVDLNNKVMVPPEEPLYTLKRVWLTKKEINGYYYGFSNQALWPLCHSTYVQPMFDESQWNTYKRVNSIFAQSVLEEIGNRKALVFIQDYHFALLPKLIKEARPETTVAQFWHIPWPRQQVFSTCPWQGEILDGLLGNDLLGFHTVRHCRNFLTTVNRVTKARVNYEKAEVILDEKEMLVRHFPISVDFEQLSQDAQKGKVKREIKRLKHNLALESKSIAISIDRLDYTKGIPQRLMAIERFLDNWPEYKGKTVFIEAQVPSRTQISSYRKLGEDVDALVAKINQKHALGAWKPIITLTGPSHPNTLAALRCMADLCIVSSLHDGMNLVAKEFVASKCDNDGILILSSSTGAARELDDALLINPLAIDQFAASIKEALDMPKSERRKRMRRKRSIVKKSNIYKWAADIFSELANLS